MATNTENDLVLQVLRILGVLAAGQNAEAEDVAAVETYVQPVFDELSNRDIVTVDNNDEIPSEWFLSLSILVADAAANEFGLAGVPRNSTDAEDPVLAAENKLREIVYARPTGEAQKTDYF